MVALGALREQALEALRSHYAAGHLRLPTLEHRLDLALAARTPEDLSGVTWDLPALHVNVWQLLKAELRASARQRPCTRVCFKSVPEVVLHLDDAPRTWRIGRDASSDVVLRDPAVSRDHALISVRGGCCSVRDLGSTNGLLLNGRAITTAALQPGDVLTFANAVHAAVR